jgi:hypothetical protein
MSSRYEPVQPLPKPSTERCTSCSMKRVENLGCRLFARLIAATLELFVRETTFGPLVAFSIWVDSGSENAEYAPVLIADFCCCTALVELRAQGIVDDNSGHWAFLQPAYFRSRSLCMSSANARTTIQLCGKL